MNDAKCGLLVVCVLCLWYDLDCVIEIRSGVPLVWRLSGLSFRINDASQRVMYTRVVAFLAWYPRVISVSSFGEMERVIV